ncbi:MAG: hypothetical protein KC613_16865 [Myxococcales bacterium]|nr:hypothetical protein [Myxococcales bacterium]
MRGLLSVVLLGLMAQMAQAAPRRGYVAAGVGIPELVHAEAGWFVAPRVSLEVHGGFPILSPLAGVGVTGWLLGQAEGGPPRHSLTVSGRARVNVLYPLMIRSKGERLGPVLEPLLGYGLVTDGGFLLRVDVGALVYLDEHHGLAGGPQGLVTLGYAF